MMTPALYTKEQDARILRREDRHPKTWRHPAPNSSFGREQLRVEFCSIVTAKAPAFALPASNGTDTRFAPNRSSSPPQRTRNDSRLPTTNRSPLRRRRSACPHSSRTSIAHARRISNIFLGINHRRDCPGCHAFGRNEIGNITCRWYRKPRLFDSGCHYGSREQQRRG